MQNTLKAQNRSRSGLFPEHQGMEICLPTHDRLRLTIPVREALIHAGATVIAEPMDDMAIETYSVRLGAKVPENLVLVRIAQATPGSFSTYHRGLRLKNEPPYPAEWGEVDGHMQAEWVPCPVCAAPLMWYEAGYVTGYRVCVCPPHHHVMSLWGDSAGQD